MEKKDLVSIIVCSYNQGKYIKECLDSVKAQTYPNIQLIVADDASPDNSVQVFENWLSENNYPAITNFHQNNTGLATVLNECIELIEGKYVKIIAADDFLHPDSIQECVAKLESLGEDYGMVFSDTYAIDDNSNILPDIADYDKLGGVPPETFKKDLLIGNRIAALTVLMKKEALIKTGTYKSDLLIEDYYRWLKINALYSTAYVPRKLAYYRLHDSNISSARKERIDEECLYLQMLFDKKGDIKGIINYKIGKLYENNKLSDFLLNQFKEYPYKRRKLKLALQYKISAPLYKFLSKII
ncbi:glycosyltransferase family 2 protein [Chryseobacterium limigenitum]|uniref:Alpha-1,3-rhamnosyltransferase n=1 Tax=Chryseobacterium limigenitum TaxID=1612149 RepID=A0A1K2IHN6_9FLAO|nr:glycosyltransferase family 2 protein [Chryseobacterium limigenitum]SFZ91171.1 alpha-1,3-rhamnosyltransferase [Chryseobacterium limigenitum]